MSPPTNAPAADAGGTPDYGALRALLGPSLTPEDFIDRFWDAQPLALHANAREETDASAPFGKLLRLSDMDALLMRARQPESRSELLLFEHLQHVQSYATPHSAFANGASIIVNHTDKIWPKANKLCAALGRCFRYAFANLYFTPHASQTAPPHSDDRDVFVLQLSGRKHWLIWPTPHPNAKRRPFAHEQAGKAEGQPPLSADMLGPPELDCVLEPGSLLYIPRGALHVADTASIDESECSLHLTIAIPTADLCYANLVLNAVNTHCFGQRRFRSSLPLGPLPSLKQRTASSGEPPPPVGVHVELRAASASSVALSLDLAADSAEGEWRRVHSDLWEAVHASVGWEEMRGELCRRMARHRDSQRAALRELDSSISDAAERGHIEVVALWPTSRLRKIVPLVLIQPGDEQGLRRVAQATPQKGGPGRHTYAHTPAELFMPLDAFCAWPLGCEFELSELPARHDFLRACCARVLLQLGVVQMRMA